MEQETIITAEYLDTIKYNDLKAKFEELGIPKVFKGGVAKAELIKSALVALKRLKDAKEPVEEEIGELKVEVKEDFELGEPMVEFKELTDTPEAIPEQAITAEYLSAINYNDLEAKYKELGISDSFKGGALKADLIKDALVALAQLRVKQEAEKALEKEDKLDKPSSETDDNEKLAEEAIVEGRLSKATIKHILKTITSNLLNSPGLDARKILLTKQKTYEALLSEY